MYKTISLKEYDFYRFLNAKDKYQEYRKKYNMSNTEFVSELCEHMEKIIELNKQALNDK